MIKAEYVDHMGNDLTVVNSARISFGNKKTELDEKDKKLINYLAKHHHYTPFEHCQLSIEIHCPMYISKQIMRHRTFSYNEISRRYTSKDLEFYTPSVFRKQHETSKQCSDGSVDATEDFKAKFIFQDIHKRSLQAYNDLIDAGVARELARGILPQNLMTEFIMSGNLRNWAHFLKLRLGKDAQEEVQLISQEIYDIMIEKFPVSGAKLLED